MTKVRFIVLILCVVPLSCIAEESLELSRRTLDGKNVKIDQLERELQERLKWVQENQREIDTLRSELVHVTDDNVQVKKLRRRKAWCVAKYGTEKQGTNRSETASTRKLSKKLRFQVFVNAPGKNIIR